MKRADYSKWITGILLAICAFCWFVPQTFGKGGSPEYVPGEVLVKFKRTMTASNRTSILTASGMSVLKEFPGIGVFRVKIRTNDTVPGATKRLAANPGVLYAEPNYIQHAVATLPNDPLFNNLWGLNNTGQTGGTPDADIDAPEAWDVSLGSSDMVVCVIDTGVTYTHPDLAANMWTNAVELGGTSGVDDDGNGYVDDIYGINAVTGSGDPMDDNAHGTHCSGTIAAVGNNGVGVAGVNWNARIMGCKFLDSGGSGSTDDAIECIEYAITKGADVMSNSWGGGGFSQALADAIEDANSAGILFVAAAGNDGSDNDAFPFYPASYDNTNIIAVAATDHNDGMASFSNYGRTSVDVGAPGVDIFSTFLTGAHLSSGCNDDDSDGYGYCSGTSMACPHVAGLSALTMSAFPSETPLEIKRRIMRTVDPLASLAGDTVSDGRINAHRALTEAIVGPHIYYVDPPGGSVGDTVTLAGDTVGSIQGSGFVTFSNGQNAAVSSWSDVQIKCQVPAGAETGNVTVTTDEGTSNGVLFTIVIPYYTESLKPQEFIGDGTGQGWQADDGCWQYYLPFAFPYFDASYSSVNICSNGFLDFTNENAWFSNSVADFKFRAMIAPLWDDLKTNGTDEDIFIHQPSAESVAIRWDGSTYSGDYPVDVEVILFQDGAIQFNYGAGNTGLTPTIGISRGDGLYYHLSPHNDQGVLTNAESDLYIPVSLTCSDNDLDGYGSPGSHACTYYQADCDDSNPGVNPGTIEGQVGDPTCSDILDNDCDAMTDLDDPGCVPCVDNDNDGYGDPASVSCTHPELDCNDSLSEVNPGATENCTNTVDDDCNRLIDNADPACKTSGWAAATPAQASAYSSSGQPGSEVWNHLAVFLLPIGLVVVLRLIQRKRT